MSLPELQYRIVQVAKTKINKYFRKAKSHIGYKYNGSISVLDQQGIKSTLKNFEFVKNFKILNLGIDISELPDWHTDISSGEKFPKIFCRDINTRNRPNRSAKFVWEVNRLQYLTHIAFAYRKTKDNKFLDLFIRMIESWIDSNPYLIGVNWYSNIELNIRLITWFFCWEILEIPVLLKSSEKLNKLVTEKWIRIIYLHCRHTSRNLSRYSSANNHLISEYAGLFVASSIWKFSESKKWNRLAKKGLEEEIVRQHTIDGINREQTAEYVQFITDFFLIAYIVGEKTENPFSYNFKGYLVKIFEYIYTMLDSNGNVPKYGDEDDGRTFILESEPEFNNFYSLLTSGVILSGNAKWKSQLKNIDSKNQILFGPIGNIAFEKPARPKSEPESKLFTESGHFYLKSILGSKEIFIHFNAAPLGYLSIAAHGHADALNFLLHINGQPILVDPGTYTYHTKAEWRNYFKGTLAHNTIRINNNNQATIGGPTMWRDHYHVKVESVKKKEDEYTIRASHDGYVKKYGIVHKRTFTYSSKKQQIHIKDDIKCKSKDSPYVLEFPLHLHPEVDIIKSESSEIELLTRKKGDRIRIITDPRLRISFEKGSLEPILGWYSESFNRKSPSITIYGSGNFADSISLNTKIKII